MLVQNPGDCLLLRSPYVRKVQRGEASARWCIGVSRSRVSLRYLTQVVCLCAADMVHPGTVHRLLRGAASWSSGPLKDADRVPGDRHQQDAEEGVGADRVSRGAVTSKGCGRGGCKAEATIDWLPGATLLLRHV